MNEEMSFLIKGMMLDAFEVALSKVFESAVVNSLDTIEDHINTLRTKTTKEELTDVSAAELILLVNQVESIKFPSLQDLNPLLKIA